jgi:4-hydroxy-2-oxoglutarate aldolase
VLGVACFWTAACVALKQAVEQSNAAEAERLQTRIAAVDREIVAKLGPAGIKVAMDRVGLIGGNPRPPLRPLTTEESERVAALVAA